LSGEVRDLVVARRCEQQGLCPAACAAMVNACRDLARRAPIRSAQRRGISAGLPIPKASHHLQRGRSLPPRNPQAPRRGLRPADPRPVPRLVQGAPARDLPRRGRRPGADHASRRHESARHPRQLWRASRFRCGRTWSVHPAVVLQRAAGHLGADRRARSAAARRPARGRAVHGGDSVPGRGAPGARRCRRRAARVSSRLEVPVVARDQSRELRPGQRSSHSLTAILMRTCTPVAAVCAVRLAIPRAASRLGLT